MTEKYTFENNVESIKFENIKLEEMNEIFKDSLEILEEGETSNIFSNEVEFIRLKLCKKEMDDKNIISKTDIEKQIYSQKFNQMANTLISISLGIEYIIVFWLITPPIPYTPLDVM